MSILAPRSDVKNKNDLTIDDKLQDTNIDKLLTFYLITSITVQYVLTTYFYLKMLNCPGKHAGRHHLLHHVPERAADLLTLMAGEKALPHRLVWLQGFQNLSYKHFVYFKITSVYE